MSFTPLHLISLLKQQAEKANWVWDALPDSRREGLSGYRGWEWLAHQHSPPAAPPAHCLLSGGAATASTWEEVLAQRCLAYRDMHCPCQTAPTSSPNHSSAPDTENITPPQYGPNQAFSISACYWGTYYCGGFIKENLRYQAFWKHYKELGRVGKLPFLLEFYTGKAFSAFTFNFSAFSASLHTHVKASHNNCTLGNSHWSNFSCPFFLLS